MPGITRRLTKHSLNILKGYKPVKEALRHFSEPKRQVMGEELAKLVEFNCVKSCMKTNAFHKFSTKYGLNSEIVASFCE